MNLYLQTLLEAAHTASVIPFGHEPTLFAMKAFGGYDMRLAGALAILGACVGQMFNFGMGKLLFKLPYREQMHLHQKLYDKIQPQFNRYGFILLLLCWAPMGNLIPVAAGLFGTRLKIVLPLVIVAELFNYGRLLF